MFVKDKLASLSAIFRVKFLRAKVPLAVRLQVINRCTLRCKYCNLWRKTDQEMSTEQIFNIIDTLSKLGTKKISLSGGEPLLRQDIRGIIDYCNQKGIYPEMNSNGNLVAKNIDVIKKLDFLKLSLDGPKEIHDYLRGEGSFEKVICAADTAFNNGVNFGFAATLTRYNIDSVDFLLGIGKRYNTIVAFQPLKPLYRGIEDISTLSPPENKFRAAIAKLINLKRNGNGHIRNSLQNLRHIYHWPKYKQLRCWAGKIFCIIDSNGDLYPCDRISYNRAVVNCLENGVRKALDNAPQVHCSGCGFCGSVELNHLMGLRFGIVKSIKKIIG